MLLVAAAQAVALSGAAPCHRATIDQQYAAELQPIEQRLRVLLDDQRQASAKRRIIANRRVELATMNPLRRSLKAATDRNYNLRDLQALDDALRQQVKVIDDEGRSLATDAAISTRKHDQAFVACGTQVKNAQN